MKLEFKKTECIGLLPGNPRAFAMHSFKGQDGHVEHRIEGVLRAEILNENVGDYLDTCGHGFMATDILADAVPLAVKGHKK